MVTPTLPMVAPQEVGLSPGRLLRLTEALRREIDGGRLPGAVALIARRGKVAYFEALGAGDPATGAPMQKDTIFRIHSMTKPIVSVAAMMLFEEGRFLLGDPLAKYIPEFADPKVAFERDGQTALVPAERDITIQDIFCHTAGLTYEFLGSGPVQRAYFTAGAHRRDLTTAALAALLGKLPLIDHPGRRWAYSRATDVLGRLVEIWSGMTLGAFLAERIFGPLGMVDTGFHAPADRHQRLAQAFARDPETNRPVELFDPRREAALQSGGGGLVSTATDYARFSQMLLDDGRFDGRRMLGRKTLELMTADHLNGLPGSFDLLVPGYGFGLGFTVRLHAGVAQTPGSIGQYSWGGLAGTTFWVDPREQFHALLMIQAPHARVAMRSLFRDMVYAAIDD